MSKEQFIQICKVKGCNSKATTDGYCRLHYIKNWEQQNKLNKQKKSPKNSRKRKENDFIPPSQPPDDLLELFNGDNYDAELQRFLDKLRLEKDLYE